MTDYYVNKSGNDSNDGLSRATAKLTVNGAFSATSSGDTVIIGAGVYKGEALVFSATTTLEFKADFDDAYGPVVLDGEDLAADGFLVSSNSTDLTFRGITFRNYPQSAIRGIGNAGQFYTFFDCQFLGCHRAINADDGFATMVIQEPSRRVLVKDCGIGVNIANGARNGQMTLRGWTFHDNDMGIFFTASVAGIINVKNCVFTGGKGTSPYMIWQNTAPPNTLILDFNNYVFDGTNRMRWAGTTVSSLASWQTTSGRDANSIDTDPVFIDPANGLLRLDATSPALALDSGALVGAGFSQRETVGISNNRNTASWTGAVLSNTSLTAGGSYELASGPEGTVATDVVDFGITRLVRRVIPKGSGFYPFEVLDKDKTDTAPNRPQFEYRGSNSSFLKTDASPAWSTAVIGEDVNQSFRYFQVRVTLRNDGVEA